MKWISIKNARVQVGEHLLIFSPSLRTWCAAVLTEYSHTLNGEKYTFTTDQLVELDNITHVARVSLPKEKEVTSE